MDFPKIENKLAFFDFDRTLVAHSYSQEYMKAIRNNYMMDCVYALTALEEEHANDRPLPCMQWYAKQLQDKGYGLYCLTHEIFNLRDKLKQRQLKEFYPDTPMTYITVSEPKHKIDMMKAISMAECCSLSDIIFVDDKMDIVREAQAEGINAKHVSDIVVMYELCDIYGQQGMKLQKKNDITETDDIHTEYDQTVNDKNDSKISEMELERILRKYHKEIEMGGGVLG